MDAKLPGGVRAGIAATEDNPADGMRGRGGGNNEFSRDGAENLAEFCFRLSSRICPRIDRSKRGIQKRIATGRERRARRRPSCVMGPAARGFVLARQCSGIKRDSLKVVRKGVFDLALGCDRTGTGDNKQWPSRSERLRRKWLRKQTFLTPSRDESGGEARTADSEKRLL